MSEKMSIIHSNTDGNDDFIENYITDAMDTLASTSKEKYEQKTCLIENATDMTTQEKLHALDENYDRHVHEIIMGVAITVLSVTFLGIAIKNPTAIKRVLRLVA